MLMAGHTSNTNDREKGKYALIKDSDEFQQGLYDKPMPCFGCGIGWFSERAGLAASAIAVSRLLFWQNVCGKINGLGRLGNGSKRVGLPSFPRNGMFAYLVHYSNDPTVLADAGAKINWNCSSL
uniref:60S ribosomal protein L18a-like protein isoform X2 n=1 Tax=Tanacetum cinerariifolium TaxID=118510 RepID=A0A699GXQ8_TANCI|nr:60S ribosomal protein L18a-like protein isoform X2 [Tanacetum cinerariifolium]